MIDMNATDNAENNQGTALARVSQLDAERGPVRFTNDTTGLAFDANRKSLPPVRSLRTGELLGVPLFEALSELFGADEAQRRVASFVRVVFNADVASAEQRAALLASAGL